MKKSILLLVIAYISFAKACSCDFSVYGWERRSVCDSTFSGLIKVEGPQYDCGHWQICYHMSIVQQYHGTPASPTILETASDGALCGVELHPGHSYFVATNPYDGNKIGVGSCSLYLDWTNFTESQMLEEVGKKYRCDGTIDIPPDVASFPK